MLKTGWGLPLACTSCTAPRTMRMHAQPGRQTPAATSHAHDPGAAQAVHIAAPGSAAGREQPRHSRYPPPPGLISTSSGLTWIMPSSCPLYGSCARQARLSHCKGAGGFSVLHLACAAQRTEACMCCCSSALPCRGCLARVARITGSAAGQASCSLADRGLHDQCCAVLCWCHQLGKHVAARRRELEMCGCAAATTMHALCAPVRPARRPAPQEQHVGPRPASVPATQGQSRQPCVKGCRV